MNDSNAMRSLTGSRSTASVHARAGEPQRALQAFAGIIDEWRRHGNLTHLVITLRNLVELLVRVGAIEAAGELLGALQPRSVTAAYGTEAQRLADAKATLERTAGEHAVARWAARGAGHDLREATNMALATIATLVQAERTQQNEDLA